MRTARFVMQVVGWSVGIPLEVLVIRSLLQNGYRRYPIVFLYLLADFVTTLVNIPVFTQAFVTHDAAVIKHAAKVYWINEWILQVLIFATVLSLIDQAISVSRWRRIMRLCLAAGALLFAGITFWMEYQPQALTTGVWMTPWTSDLSLCATILDLGLWMILIASRKSDRRLMLVCGAFGMQFTAGVIGGQVSSIATPRRSLPLALLGSVIVVAGNLLCLYVWWQTFRTAKETRAAVKHT